MARVELRENGEVVDAREWASGVPLSTQLLENIDELLRANNLDLKDITKIETAQKGPKSSFMALRAGFVIGEMLEVSKSLDKS